MTPGRVCLFCQRLVSLATIGDPLDSQTSEISVRSGLDIVESVLGP